MFPPSVVRPEPVDPEGHPRVGPATSTGPPSPRQCGRCRSMFPGDPALDPSAAPRWWVCPPCRLALFPSESREHKSSRWATARVTPEELAPNPATRRPTALVPAPGPAAGDPPPHGTARPKVGPSWFSQRGEHEEIAQGLARRSIELAEKSGGDDIREVALELMRASNHDAATLQHALVMCRSLSRDDPTDERVKRGIRLLQQVTTFLGVPPPLFDAGHAPTPGHYAAARS
jgi:hypothetical protein